MTKKNINNHKINIIFLFYNITILTEIILFFRFITWSWSSSEERLEYDCLGFSSSNICYFLDEARNFVDSWNICLVNSWNSVIVKIIQGVMTLMVLTSKPKHLMQDMDRIGMFPCTTIFFHLNVLCSLNFCIKIL